MSKKLLLIILLLLIIGCTNADDEEYIVFEEVDIHTLIGDEEPDNCYINESGDEICIFKVEN